MKNRDTRLCQMNATFLFPIVGDGPWRTTRNAILINLKTKPLAITSTMMETLLIVDIIKAYYDNNCVVKQTLVNIMPFKSFISITISSITDFISIS